MEMFLKKDIFKNFAKFTKKHRCPSLFFDKVAGLAYNFVEKETLAQEFSSEFCKYFKNIYFAEIYERLLLTIKKLTKKNFVGFSLTALNVHFLDQFEKVALLYGVEV